MKIIYDENDLLAILQDYHSYGKQPIKVGYLTQEVLDIEFKDGWVQVLIGEPEDE